MQRSPLRWNLGTVARCHACAWQRTYYRKRDAMHGLTIHGASCPKTQDDDDRPLLTVQIQVKP